MITEYRPVTWSPGEPVASAKLATMAQNDQVLFESLPKFQFNNQGIKKDRGVKVLSLVGLLPATSATWATTTIYFGDMFSIGCRPVVTMGINAGPRMRFHVVLNGIGTRLPDHRGCVVSIAADEILAANNSIGNNVYVHITAVGF